MKDTLDAAMQMVDGRSMKISESVKMKEVEVNIQNQYYKIKPMLKTCAGNFRKTAEELLKHSKHFMVLEYQIYVASSLYLQEGPFVSAIVAPG